MPYCTEFTLGRIELQVTVLQGWTEFLWDFMVGPVGRKRWHPDARFLADDLIHAMTGPEGEGFYTLREAKAAFARSMMLLQRDGWDGLSWTGTWRRC